MTQVEKEETLEYVLDMQLQQSKLAKKKGLPHLALLIDGLIEAAIPHIAYDLAADEATCTRGHSQKRN